MQKAIHLAHTCVNHIPGIFHFTWHVVHPIAHALGLDRWLGI